MFGRRTVQVGDTVAFDTPYLNGVADVIDGPNTEKGTKSLPKWLFQFRQGVIADPSTGYVGELTSDDKGWFEDNAEYISIFGVDDENITIL